MSAQLADFSPFFDFFTPYLTQNLTLYSPFFSQSKASVGQFVAEMHKTCQMLVLQQHRDSAEVYADRLFKQFEALKKAVEQQQTKQQNATFTLNHRFPKNIHSLPLGRRLKEYRIALRALDEKISWLENQLLEASGEQKASLLANLQTTQFRREKCRLAIDELEYEESQQFKQPTNG